MSQSKKKPLVHFRKMDPTMSECCSLCNATITSSSAKSVTDICDDVTGNTDDVIKSFKEIVTVHFWQDSDLMEILSNANDDTRICEECQNFVQKIDKAEKVRVIILNIEGFYTNDVTQFCIILMDHYPRHTY